MDYKEQITSASKDDLLSLVTMITCINERMNYNNFMKWIEEYPEYWTALCNMHSDEITPEYAEKVMKTLIDSNITVLQTVWMFKCGDKIDIFGKAANDDKE